ncbi:MAG: hypothetical protein JXB50_16320 [Spirochaetes bacterium]|nr:hypothetical protein [Spirochaetota bacterium]
MVKFVKDLVWGFIPKKIYGLVGPPGSGKSFRAYLIADRYKIDYIIDDGLLIKGQKIIAGRSAKKEVLRVTAIKRAIFQDFKHAREVRKALYRERFTSVLVIGTSELMLKRICTRLHVPFPSKIIKIEDIATEDEIKEAILTRKKHGKHVMPIPLIEVKKKYPNIILHAIHFFINEPKGFFFKKNRKKLIEKTIVRPNYGENGRISISETALLQMVNHCINEYSSDIKLLKVLVKELDESYSLFIKLSVSYLMNNADVIKDIQKIIKEKIESFTGIEIENVNIEITKVTN